LPRAGAEFGLETGERSLTVGAPGQAWLI